MMNRRIAINIGERTWALAVYDPLVGYRYQPVGDKLFFDSEEALEAAIKARLADLPTLEIIK